MTFILGAHMPTDMLSTLSARNAAQDARRLEIRVRLVDLSRAARRLESLGTVTGHPMVEIAALTAELSSLDADLIAFASWEEM